MTHTKFGVCLGIKLCWHYTLSVIGVNTEVLYILIGNKKIVIQYQNKNLNEQ